MLHGWQEANFATFADDVGGSERLFKTPIPLSYTRLTSRFLVLYHLFLPFALWDSLNWLTIPVTIIHTAIFFCIEEVGVLIENPFPVLALDVIAQSARNNVAVSPRPGILPLGCLCAHSRVSFSVFMLPAEVCRLVETLRSV